ncbi:transposable element Tc1 transposase [Trichonephila clavipes]|nr:transposable element Tc1 transposase [Trichonephila clavipes]
MPWEKHRASFEQVSAFERGKLIVYKEYELSFREIGQRVGRNQSTMMRICHSSKQDKKTDRRCQSHPPRCSTASDDWRIVCMAVIDHALTS